MIAVVDYGAGNLFSVRNALNALELENVITSDPEVLRRADKLILPGVGAFPDAMKKLRETGLDQVILEEVEKGKPLLGICLGMQMLFDKSFEFGETSGLGLIPGEVVYMDCPDLKIPHLGWSSIEVENACPLAKDIKA
ncbi:MAG: imidazole glycerol phosphate synthase subunit HisH, partial [Firmicutes bacterium]|nr:imidazole glycerol phosphate synthase subunit HisH [Bacillota bacterium]